MKIIVADKISERGIALLRDAGWDVLTPTAAALPSEIVDADALVVRSATKVTAALLEKAARLRVIGRAGVGIDNVDVDAATRRGVLVMNTPGGNSVSVAEHTLALMLGLARAVPQANASIHAGKWEKSAFSGTELRGKTMGLVGLGRVGTEVARRARALEMKVIAYDPFVTPAAAQAVEVELVPLDELLRRSDVISLHTSLSAQTEKLIDAAAIAKMKKGVRIVNCARGELIDEAALADALKSGHVAGAGLDTFAHEPPKGSPLVGLHNVIATPHIAGSTAEAQEEVGTAIAQQIRDFLADGSIRNAVNVPRFRPTNTAACVPTSNRASASMIRGAGRAFAQFHARARAVFRRARRNRLARDLQSGAGGRAECRDRRQSEPGERGGERPPRARIVVQETRGLASADIRIRSRCRSPMAARGILARRRRRARRLAAHPRARWHRPRTRRSKARCCSRATSTSPA